MRDAPDAVVHSPDVVSFDLPAALQRLEGAPAQARERRIVERGGVQAFDMNAPARGVVEQSDDVEQGALARSGRPGHQQ